MKVGPRLIARIALFSALIYVLSWGTSFLPNVSLAFFVAFAAGYLMGVIPGVLTGAIGMWLFTSMNPFGPAVPPVAAAQVIGLAGSGLIGGLVGRGRASQSDTPPGSIPLVLCSLACTVVYYLPVTVIDAWFAQPFWPRLIGGLPYVAVSIAANAIIFPLLFPVTVRINRLRKGDR